MFFTTLLLSAATAAQLVCAAEVVISNSDSREFGAYVNPNPKNICDGDELEMLTICASEVVANLEECEPDDLACECCALQIMEQDCHGLCPNTPSGNFLAVLYDDCETMNDVNACNLPFKKHDALVAKSLRPDARLPVEEKEPDLILPSILVNTANESTVVSHLEQSHHLGHETNGTSNASDEKHDDVENGAASLYRGLSGMASAIALICVHEMSKTVLT